MRRRLIPVVAASFTAGLLAYYAADRVRVLTGHTYRDLRHAGWSQQKAT